MSSATAESSRGDATRRSLLAAATERFARDGYRATSVADISRDAGVGGTTAYVHYPNKESLFLAAVDDDLTALFEEVIAAVTHSEPRDDWYTGLFPELLAALERHPLARRLVAGLEPSMTVLVLETEAFDELRATIANLIATAQDDGSIRPDLAPGLLADGLVSLVVSLAMAVVQIGDAVLTVFGPGLATAFAAILTPDPRIA